jgi:hypothetical protein
MIDWTAVGITALAIVIILIVIWIIWMISRSVMKKRITAPSHFELYFAENFRNLIDEWDIQSRPKVKAWRTDITKRLNTVGSDIDRLKKFQRKMDTRLTKLTKELTKLEGL